ncbi:MAG: aminotransferase class III-fold pyridoxal phosphate-dependent enzyme [Candidatus Micrarchaeota archaeon]
MNSKHRVSGSSAVNVDGNQSRTGAVQNIWRTQQLLTNDKYGSITLRNVSVAHLGGMHNSGARFSNEEVDTAVSAHKPYINTYRDDMFPFICAGAKGKYMYLVPISGENKGMVLQVYDAFNSYGVASAVGHANDDIIDVAVAQMRRGGVVAPSFYTPSKAALSEYLLSESGIFSKLLPGYNFYMLSSGSESNDAALKLACEYQTSVGEYEKRNVIIAMKDGFHGRTGFAINLNEKPYVSEGFPKISQKVVFVKFGDVQSLETAFKENVGRVLSVHFEPVQGETGVIVPKKEYFERMRNLCSADGAVMVADEVQTFARTGQWFASIGLGSTPDIIVTGKISSAALVPASLIYTRPDITFGEHRHGNTYTGNPLACEVTLATFRHIEENNLLDNSRNVGEYLMGSLRETLGDKVVEVRGMGGMIGIQLDKSLSDEQIWDYCLKAVENGLLITPTGKALRILLPLSITRPEADMIVGVLGKVLQN